MKSGLFNSARQAALLCLCCSVVAVGQEESPQDDKEKGSVNDIIRRIVKDAGGDDAQDVDVEVVVEADQKDGKAKRRVAGKAIIIDADGNKKEIDLSKALKGIHLGHGKDGKVVRKAIIVGADGKKKEIDLSKAMKGIHLGHLQDGKVKGKAIVISGDGKKKEIDLSRLMGGQKGSVRDIVRQVIKKSGGHSVQDVDVDVVVQSTGQDGNVKRKVAGKAIIIDADGNKKEIDLSKALKNARFGDAQKKMIVRVDDEDGGKHEGHQVHVIVEDDEDDGQDGQRKRRVIRRVVTQDGTKGKKKANTFRFRHRDGAAMSGRMIIVDDEGKKREIDLSKLDGKAGRMLMIDGNKVMGAEGFPFAFDVLKDGKGGVRMRHFAHAAGKYRVGVHCEAVGDALRAHVEVPEGAVIVREVIDGGPAEKAGLKTHDILVSVGDAPVKSVEGLVRAIQEADGKEMTFAIIRRGKRQRVEVTPEERPAATSVVDDEVVRKWISDRGVQIKEGKMLDPNHNHIVIESIQPGVVFGKDFDLSELSDAMKGMQFKRDGRGFRYELLQRGKKKGKDADKPHRHDKDAHDHEGDGHDEDAERHEKRRDGWRDGDKDDDEEGEDDERGEVRERVRELTREIQRLQRQLKKLESKRRG